MPFFNMKSMNALRSTGAELLTALVVLCAAGPLWAGPVAAILPFEGKDKSRGEELSVRLTSEVVRKQAFPVAERNQLKNALTELAKGDAGIFQTENSSRLGQLVGADYLVVGEVFPAETGSSMRAAVRILKAETGVVIGAGTAEGSTEEIAREFAAIVVRTVSIYAMLSNPDSPYSVLLRLDKGQNPRYKIGETLTLKFKVIKHEPQAPNRVFLSLYSIDANGNMILIFPNRFSGKEGILVDKEYSFPDAKDDFEWKLVPPAGHETLQAIVSTKPVRIPGERSMDPSGFTAIEGKESVRSYGGIQTQLKEDKRGDWAAERITYFLGE
jgi:hypothetical protein